MRQALVGKIILSASHRIKETQVYFENKKEKNDQNGLVEVYYYNIIGCADDYYLI